MINPYKVLGVHRRSTDNEIHTAYITLAKQHHPDQGGDASKFKKINEAHKLIATKSHRRKFLDSLLADECKKCKGMGSKFKSVGLTDKIYTGCPNCGGAGFIIDDEEIEDVTIKL